MAPKMLTPLMMDYVKPVEVVQKMLETAVTKAGLSVADFLIRGFLSGALLGFATTLAFTATKQTSIPLVGAIIFPVGFVLIILLGLELVTGNFALLPLAYQAKRITLGQLLANLGWVYLGNLVGSIFYGYLFVVTLSLNASAQATIAPLLVAAAEAKTVYYAQHGMEGLLVCIVKSVLCNWMVCLGTIAAMTSTSTLGKIVASAMPIFIFFAQGFEHSVVNVCHTHRHDARGKGFNHGLVALESDSRDGGKPLGRLALDWSAALPYLRKTGAEPECSGRRVDGRTLRAFNVQRLAFSGVVDFVSVHH